MTVSGAPLRLLVLSLAIALLTSGCGQRRLFSGDAGATTIASPSVEKGTIHIGYQKSGALDVLRLRGDLERRLAPLGVKVDWTNFAAGPQTLEALGVGSIDLSNMGDTPPIFAQAAGVPLVYIANQPPGDSSGRAILVAHDSPIRTVSDLRGKRIAVQKASGTHNFLVQALDKAGVPYSSVQVEYLAPPDGRAAFESGRVDAWAIWDPYLAAAQQDMKARVLLDGRGIVSAGGFYLSSRKFATAHPDWIRVTLEEVDKTAVWIGKHPHEAAELLAPSMGVSVDKLEAIQKRARKGEAHVGFHPIDAKVISVQQRVADNFYRIGLLPKKVAIKDAVLTPEQYRTLTPAGATIPNQSKR